LIVNLYAKVQYSALSWQYLSIGIFNPNRSLDRSTVLFFWKKALRVFCPLLPKV